MRKCYIILFLLLVVCFVVNAQNDTIMVDSTLNDADLQINSDTTNIRQPSVFAQSWRRPCTDVSVHKFRATGLIAPVLLFSAGATIAFTPKLNTSIDLEFRNLMQRNGHKHIFFEDYVVCLPAVATYGLNLCGLKGKHGYRDLTTLTAASYIIAYGIALPMKYGIDRMRPNGDHFSFPSGHTIAAFTGAEILRREFKDYPVVGIVGYVVAVGVGFMRIYNNKHWVSDVLAGAGIGILSTSITYWLASYVISNKATRKKRKTQRTDI